jgi:hypothetical protein
MPLNYALVCSRVEGMHLGVGGGPNQSEASLLHFAEGNIKWTDTKVQERVEERVNFEQKLMETRYETKLYALTDTMDALQQKLLCRRIQP